MANLGWKTDIAWFFPLKINLHEIALRFTVYFYRNILSKVGKLLNLCNLIRSKKFHYVNVVQYSNRSLRFNSLRIYRREGTICAGKFESSNK